MSDYKGDNVIYCNRERSRRVRETTCFAFKMLSLSCYLEIQVHSLSRQEDVGLEFKVMRSILETQIW